MKKQMIIGVAIGFFLSAVVAVVVGLIHENPNVIDLGGALCTIFGGATLIFGLTRKD